MWKGQLVGGQHWGCRGEMMSVLEYAWVAMKWASLGAPSQLL